MSPEPTRPVAREIQDAIFGQVGSPLVEGRIDAVRQPFRFAVLATGERNPVQIPAGLARLAQGGIHENRVPIVKGNPARLHLSVRLGTERLGRVDQPQSGRLGPVKAERPFRVRRKPVENLKANGLGRVPDGRTAHLPCLQRLLPEHPLLARCCDIGSIQVPRPIEIVFQLGHASPVKFEVDFLTTELDGNAEMASGQSQAAGFPQRTSSQPSVQTPFFGKQADQPLVVGQGIEQPALRVGGLRAVAKLCQPLLVLACTMAPSSEQEQAQEGLPSQKDTPQG